jgi:hypothetical protein
MGNIIDTKVILGSLKYKTSVNTDISIPTPLTQNSKILNEFDRSIDINLSQLFDDERQKSNIFRPTCKFQVLFDNSYTGITNYAPLENNLYYINELTSSFLQCAANPNDVYWEGFLQYNEFDFIRNDSNVVGYTQPPDNHINFVTKSASSYNWNFFISYPFSGVNKNLEYFIPDKNRYFSWKAFDGIPFYVKINDSTLTSIANGVTPNPLLENGNPIIQFNCPVKHGVSVGEYINVNIPSTSFNGVFQVFSLGNGLPGTDEYFVNIYNIGFTGTTFDNEPRGTFKRVINNDNPNDTTSKYYVLQHKILTNVEDYVLVNAGFEKNIFGVNKKFESSGLTPNKISRTSVKNNSQSYSLSFNVDIDINELRDNQKRPLSELYVTTIWKGYFGFTFGLQTTSVGYSGLKQGWDFNLPLTNSKNPNNWWSLNTSDSNFVDGNNQQYPLGTLSVNNSLPFTISGGPGNGPLVFKYMESLKEGDILDGGFYEWNDYEQKERLISEINHKFTFNPFIFDISKKDNNRNQLGYYYKPHNKIKIRDFSDYIETGNVNNVDDVPDYAYFSTTYGSFIWRDIYSYGFKDTNRNGVDYPFLNGKHYPYENFIFRIIPEGTNYIESNLNNYATLYGAAQPTKDDCE